MSTHNSIVPFSKETAKMLLHKQETEKFPISLEEARVWLEYSRKDHAKAALIGYGFVEDVDYEVLTTRELRPQGGFSSKEDIYLTVDCFKQLGMVSRTEKGKEIRQYFIECEKELKALAAVQPMSQTEIVAFLASKAVETEKQLAGMQQSVIEVKEAQKKIEQKVDAYTPREGWNTTEGFQKVHKFNFQENVGFTLYNAVHQRMKTQGIGIEPVKHPFKGEVPSFPENLMMDTLLDLVRNNTFRLEKKVKLTWVYKN